MRFWAWKVAFWLQLDHWVDNVMGRIKLMTTIPTLQRLNTAAYPLWGTPFSVEETVEKHLFEVLSSRQVFSGQVIGLLSLLNVMMRNQRWVIFGGPMTVALCNKSLESFESTIMCLRGSLNPKEEFDVAL